ncbi:MAG TPA: PilZ domain-containing protein [Phycisphaerae bacterium]|nr:PilZ domain-containing protein [Phycisphaerae bacterium]HNU45003.1 PilZ domain-containing protein [Phycisphaerae bacterium]
MISTPLTPVAWLGELESETAAAVLARALETRVILRLRPDEGERQREVPARLVGGNDDTLTVELPPGNLVFAGVPESASIEARFSVDSRYYMFTTRRHELTATPTAGLLLLERPRTLALVERRRSPRRRWRPGAQVTLLAAEGEPRHLDTAEMLNLSLHGLSCRLPGIDAEWATVGQRLRVRFCPGKGGPLLELPVRLCNVTPDMSLTRTLIGVEFVEGAAWEAAQPALTAALAGQP